jgi:hypothetical protein
MTEEITLPGDRVFRMIQDDNAMDPREWDNLGTMACFHKRYGLGDQVHFSSDQFYGWDEMYDYIENDLDAAVILPLYLYDHSGITISTEPFSCRWDSGQIGFIYVTKETLRKEYSVDRITEKIKEKARKVLLAEVETYDQYLTGDVYGFEIVKLQKCDEGHVHEKTEDSCWGFFGSDIKENGILDHVNTEDAKIILGEL